MATKTWDSVLFEKTGPVATLTLNRPEVLNAQDHQLLTEVLEAFEAANDDDEVRVIILTGAGRSFSAGHDLGSARSREYRAAHPLVMNADAILEYEEKIFVDWCLRVHDLPKPTIAQVQGFAIIGGWMLVNACDLIVAADDAVFSDRAARFAAPSGEFNTYVYDVGARKAKELLFTGDYISAQELYRLGAINRIVPAERLAEETMALAQQIARTDPFLLKLVKRSVNEVLDHMGFRTAMRTQHYLHVMAHTHYQVPGVQAPVPSLNDMTLRDWLKVRDAPFENQPAAATGD